MHPELRRGNKTLDLKSVGPSAFRLMKQKRGGKFIFEGKFPLIKFGIFEENDRSESEDQSIPTESEDIVHSTSEPEFEEIHDSPTSTVVEEHDYHMEDETKSTHEDDDDDDLYGDVQFLKEIDFTGFSDDIPTNIDLDLNDEEFGPLLGFLNGFLIKVNEVALRQPRLGNKEMISKFCSPHPSPWRMPQPHTSQSSMETSQSIMSLEVPIVGNAHHVFSTVTATTAYSPIQSDEGPSTMFETGGSSSIPEYSPTKPSLD
ncbi:unnamed protein product [Lactuca saligna]|uniref:Uncharacterized protein n=1 Tax=Lactuca saligna TaxID=75948 RepID=A0AA35ZFW5_LACSI|nr:unnamed protein product [Lactuca saligna]